MQLDRIDPAFGHWLAGFADGEGCFYVARVVSRGYVNYRCAFSISLRDDDESILVEIRDTLGCGVLMRRAPRPVAGFNSVAPMVCLQVGNKQDVRDLVMFFDRFPLRAKKARDYAIWREAVLEWHSKKRGGGRHHGCHDWSRMAQLHQDLKDVRRYQSA